MASPELIKAVKEYDEYMERPDHKLDSKVTKAYTMAVGTAFIGEKDPVFGMEVAAKAKKWINAFCFNQTGGGNIYDLEAYASKHHTRYELVDQWYSILLCEAPYRFHSYLLYLERNRPEHERFYSPKLLQLNKLGLIQAMQDLEDDKLQMLSISLPPGTGKGFSDSAKILTPNGYVRGADIYEGMEIIAGNGKRAVIQKIFPQGKRDMYRFTFDDGSTCEVSDNHLWYTQTRDDRRRGNKYRVVETSEMIKNFRVENGSRANYSIDYVPRFDFNKIILFLHPYVMGVLLGDGCITTSGVRITSPDIDLIKRVGELLPNECSVRHITRYDYLINGCAGKHKRKNVMKNILRLYDLYGCRSYEKFIPREYLFATYEDRLELLRGILDTDGYAFKTGIEYTTVSERLAHDVRDLVHSLGGYCSMRKKRNVGYKKDGKFVRCKDAYRLIIQFSADHPNPFWLKRKADRYKPKRKTWKRYITNIEYIGKEECKCIYINDSSHLYVTDDYIITHNTTLEKFFASWIIGRHPEDYSLFFSHSADITDIFYRGVLDICTNNTVYTFNHIFPEVKLEGTNAKAQTINFGAYKPYASLQCTSVGSKNAGRVRTNRYLYCDDLIGGIEEALNKSRLDKLWSIYSTDARQRKLNEQVKEIHIATRWSVHDIIGRLKVLYEKADDVRFIAAPDIDPETGESNFEYKYDGMSVEFFNDQALAMDDISYRCLYKNEPIEREGLLYHEDELRRFLELPAREPDAILGICDVKNKGTDFMFLPCCYQYDDDFYCVDCVCDDNSDYGVQYSKLANIILEHNMQQCEFESNSGGDRVSFEVNRRVVEQGGRCNITDKPTETNKETRIIVNADWVKKHVLFKDKSLYTPKEDYGVMMAWLLKYSVVGRKRDDHDDVPDGWANFALYVTRGKRVSTVEAIQNPFRRRQ